MVQKPAFLTREGLRKLEAELEHLRTVRRAEVAERIQKAKELGSAQNNAEYDEAKNEQAFVEGRILTLENIIKNAAIFSSKSSSNMVQMGSKVVVMDQNRAREEYVIVGSAEANPRQGRISNESPIGKALLGKRPGDEVEVNIPAGTLKLAILEIS